MKWLRSMLDLRSSGSSTVREIIKKHVPVIKKNTYLYPVRILRRVDLPAPEGPIIAVSSPDRSRPLTDLRIVFSTVK